MTTPTKTLEKKIGQTPLQAIREFFPNTIKASYAGRLDPMATGKLLILLGEETKKKERYLELDKEYIVEILLDIETDTGDILGIPKEALQQTKLSNNIIQKALYDEIGTHTREYPHFSSKPVNGKPLFVYALEGTINTIEIPTHEETIYHIEFMDTRFVSSEYLADHIQEKLSHVPRSTLPKKALGADFRQDEIREEWNTLLSTNHRGFQIIKIRVVAGSGSYMRTLAMRLGETFGTNALALSIHRSKLGKYKTFFTIPIWTKLY
ncbi:hypothetical protein COB87_000165 [Candidatus Wolfebacteria bacterium]|nr:hypothetical protein [Candidatus Wolfebacteria bacterium]